LLGVIVLTLSAYYIIVVTTDNYAGLEITTLRLTGVEYFWLVLGTLGTLGLSVAYHVLALRRIEAHTVPATTVAVAYALGQIARYIPGRVFGLLFQVSFLSEKIRAATIVIAVLVQTAYDYAWAALFLGLLLLVYRTEAAWPLAMIAPAICLVWLLHRHAVAERVLSSKRILGRFYGEEQIQLIKQPPYSLPASLVLALVWIPMLLGISAALSGHVGMTEGLALGALYLFSVVLSLLIIVVPSGLVVREALFAWLGDIYGFAPDMLLVLAVILRLALTIAEVLLALILLAADSARRYANGSRKND
jgi:hypothetical protein